MRKTSLLFSCLILAGAAGMGWRAYEDYGLPRHEGQTVRVWFTELCWVTASAQRGLAEPARAFECKHAILAIGTNAVPFLVRQAMSGRQDGWVRQGLRRFSLQLPGPWARRWFVPYPHIQAEAAWLVRPLQPTAAQLLPLVEPGLGGANDVQRHMGLNLLGAVGDGAERGVPYLLEALGRREDPWVRAVAAQSIRGLSRRAADVLEAVLAIMDPEMPDPNLLKWMAELGAGAAMAVPALERVLESENDTSRINAALALLNIQPGHEAAFSVLAAAAGREAATTPLTRGLQEELELAVIESPRRPNERLGGLLEPLARAEILAWTVGNASYQAARAMERVAPGRVQGLYQEALNGPAASHAAAGLLRLNRVDEPATLHLVAAAQGDSEGSILAVLSLGEASSRNTLGMRTLDEILRLGDAEDGDVPTIKSPRVQARLDAAAYARARVRLRERLEEADIDELGW